MFLDTIQELNSFPLSNPPLLKCEGLQNLIKFYTVLFLYIELEQNPWPKPVHSVLLVSSGYMFCMLSCFFFYLSNKENAKLSNIVTVDTLKNINILIVFGTVFTYVSDSCNYVAGAGLEMLLTS